MTLHWWMHWFWVTTLLILIGSSGSLAAPQPEELEYTTIDRPTEPNRPMDRQPRAMYFTKTPPAPPASPTPITPITRPPTDITNQTVTNQTAKPDTLNNTDTDNATTEIVHPAIQWIPTNTTEIINTIAPNNTITNTTVTSANMTEPQNATFASKKRNLTTLDFVKDDSVLEGVSESRIVTNKPLTLETTYLQTRIPSGNVESSPRIKDPGREGDMDMGAIAGISFAALVLAALAGSTAFVLYRRRYLNKPQTLNDKCSNPDSSGYLDDSTIRDNSEEMYSLDNDSFLNSLEAMTIQNYWTDTVKHTKL